jgi:hypothetical protein
MIRCFAGGFMIRDDSWWCATCGTRPTLADVATAREALDEDERLRRKRRPNR